MVSDSVLSVEFSQVAAAHVFEHATGVLHHSVSACDGGRCSATSTLYCTLDHLTCRGDIQRLEWYVLGRIDRRRLKVFTRSSAVRVLSCEAGRTLAGATLKRTSFENK